MQAIPAYCEHCHGWTPAMIFGAQQTNVRILNGAAFATECRHCSELARVPDLSYEIVNGAVGILDSAGLSAEQIAELYRLFKSTAEDKIPIDVLTDTISREYPLLAGLNQILKDNPSIVFLIATILALPGAIAPFIQTNSGKEDADRIIKKQQENTDRLIQALSEHKPEIKPESKSHDPRPTRKKPRWSKTGQKFSRKPNKRPK